jgi:hypothetical protein
MNVEEDPLGPNNKWAGQVLTKAARRRRARERGEAIANYSKKYKEAALKPQAPKPEFPLLRGPGGVPLRPAYGGTRRRRTRKKSN